MKNAEYRREAGCLQRDSAEHEEYVGAQSVGSQEPLSTIVLIRKTFVSAGNKGKVRNSLSRPRKILCKRQSKTV